MKTSISLVGFMGAGKSAVGKALAARLGKSFVELDSVIERKAEMSIPEIFQRHGEIAFRELEIEAAKEVSGLRNTVLACGGGTVLNRINIDRLRNESVVVYLKALPEVLLVRMAGTEGERPVLKACDGESAIKELLTFREPFYDRAADIEVDTSRLDIGAVVERIVRELRANESFGV